MNRTMLILIAMGAGCSTGGAIVIPKDDGAVVDTDTDVDTDVDTAAPFEEVAPLELCINEFVPGNHSWVDEELTEPADWIELHNPTETDVDLAGWSITDDVEVPDKHVFDPGLIVDAGGFVVLYADGEPDLGPRHLSFQLDADGETIGLYRDDGTGSVVNFGLVHDNFAVSRAEDCCMGDCFEFRPSGTPGDTNLVVVIETEDIELLPKGSTWRYFDLPANLPADWPADSFDDGIWREGPAPIGYGDPHFVSPLDPGPNPQQKRPAAYFRNTFEVADPLALLQVNVGVLRDDAAVVYLNGEEVYRDTNLPAGPLSGTTYATSTVSNETSYVTFLVDPTTLLVGTNQIAAEVHQSTPSSSDMGFGMYIEAEIEVVPVP